MENRILRDERDILKKGHTILREPATVRFAFAENWRHHWPVEMLCQVIGISLRGYRSWRTRPISQRDCTDMKVLAYVREQCRLGLCSFGRQRSNPVLTMPTPYHAPRSHADVSRYQRYRPYSVASPHYERSALR